MMRRRPQCTTFVTQQIAAFVTDIIYPRADAFIDLHSGGLSLNIIPSAIIEAIDDPVLQRKSAAARAPLRLWRSANGRRQQSGRHTDSDRRVLRRRPYYRPREMGGGGTVSIDALALCRKGVRNALVHLGVLPPDRSTPPSEEAPILALPGADAYAFATVDGVFEPLHSNGRQVRAGSPPGASIARGYPGASERSSPIRQTAFSMVDASRDESIRVVVAS